MGHQAYSMIGGYEYGTHLAEVDYVRLSYSTVKLMAIAIRTNPN